MHIYIYIYTQIYSYTESCGKARVARPRRSATMQPRGDLNSVYAQSSYLHCTLLTLLDSNFPGNPLWAWEFHPLELRLCLSQTP